MICSALNLTCMSLERFYAIVYPLKSRSVCTVSQARRVVGLAWIMAALLALPRNWIQVRNTLRLWERETSSSVNINIYSTDTSTNWK